MIKLKEAVDGKITVHPTDPDQTERIWVNVFKQLAQGHGHYIDYGPRESSIYDWNDQSNYDAAIKEYNKHMNKIAKPLNKAINRWNIMIWKMLIRQSHFQKIVKEVIRDVLENTIPCSDCNKRLELDEIKWKRVIRNKKVVKKAFCPDGYRFDAHKRKCVRISPEQARKMKGKMAKIARKRMKSMKKRTSTLGA